MHQKLNYIHLLKKSYLAYLQGKEEKWIVNHLVQMMPHGRILKCSESCDSKIFNNLHFVSINSMHYTKKTFLKKKNSKSLPVFIIAALFVISLTHASCHLSPSLFLCLSLLLFLSLCLYAALFHETHYEFSYDWIFHYFDYKNVDEVLSAIYTKSIILKFSNYTFFTITVC